MEPGLDQLRTNYEKFDDKKLIRIATQDAARLRPEAVDLLKQIIRERGLSEEIIKGIDVQLREIDDETLLNYTELLRSLPCPVCKSATEKLNATMTASVISFIIFTNYNKELKIACPDCLDKANNQAMLKSALFGWWGFPWGIIRTPQAIILNSRMKEQNRLEEANDLLNAFVIQRIGRLETNRDNPAKLREIIEHIR